MGFQKRIVSLFCAFAVSAAMFPLGVPASAARNSASFYEDLAQLLSEDDTSAYFNSMTLAIGSRDLVVDGVTTRMDVAPDVQNQRTMLPIRAVAEAAGATVDYEPETNTAVIEGLHGEEIRCPIGASQMSVNSQTYDLDSPSYAKNGRTYLPVRAVSEALNLNVEWEQSTSTVTITAPYQTSRVLVWSESLDTRGISPRKTLYNGECLWVLQFDSPAEAADAVEQLTSQGYAAEPDFYISPIEPEESMDTFSGQSGLSWGVADCKFDRFVSQNKSKLSGSGVVAVVDTGVDSTHPFLKGKVLSGTNTIDGRGTQDENSHGTHVAGTIIDCVGDAPVKILPVRALGANGEGTSSSVASGILYAVQNGADVVNLSLGSSGHASTMDQVIAYAIQNGVTVVAAAGNENSDTSTHCPAHMDIPGILVVASGDSSHNKASSSNYGNNIDLMAPGVAIKSSVPGGGYAQKWGTSMATPHAAAAAMLLDLAWGKTLSPAEIETKVHTATTNGRWTNKYVGYGFLNMANADVPAVTTPPTTTPAPTAPPSTEPTTPPTAEPTTPPEATTPPSTPPATPPVETTPPSTPPVETTPPTTPPENTYTALVTCYADVLNIRTGAGTNHAKIGEMALGSLCTVYPDKTKDGWYWVESNGVTGYAAGNKLTKYTGSTRTGVVTCNADVLNVRKGPSTSYDKVGQIPNGATCTVYTDVKDNWYFVSYGGFCGYASKNKITLK